MASAPKYMRYFEYSFSLLFFILLFGLFSGASICAASGASERAASGVEFGAVDPGFVKCFTGEPHSMESPGRYAASKTLAEIVRGTASGAIGRVAIVEGGKKSAGIWLEKLGASDVVTRTGANLKGEKWEYLEAFAGGETMAVEYHAFGADMARHLMLSYAFAGVPPSKISGAVRRGWQETAFSDFRSFLRRLGRVDVGIIGYRRSIIRHIYWRLNASRKARSLRDAVSRSGGLEAFAGGIKKALLYGAGLRQYLKAGADLSALCLAADRIGRMGDLEFARYQEKLFVSSYEYYRFGEADGAAGRIAKAVRAAGGRPVPGSAFDETGIAFEEIKGRAGEFFDIPFDIRRVTFITRNGGRIVAAACEHPYGSMAAPLVRAMAAAGAGKIFFYGSAGSLASLPRYRVIVPGAFEGAPGTIANPFQKEVAGWMSEPGFRAEDGGLSLTGLHASVFSPLCETARAIAEMKARGVSSVDVEAAHVMRESLKRGVPAFALFIATDFPGTGGTLEEWDRESAEYVRAQMKALDLIIRDIDAVGVVIK